MAIVWRKKAEGQKLVQEARKEAILSVSDWISTMLSKGKIKLSLDTYIEILGMVLSIFTKYEKIVGLKGEGINAVSDLVTNYIFSITTQSIIEGLSKGVGTSISNPYVSYYILVKLLLPTPKKGVRKLDKNSLTFLNVTGNINIKELQDNGIVAIDKDSITIIEPDQSAKGELDVISALEQLPDVRKALQGNYNFSNPVQVFHYLEYIALKNSDRLNEEIEKLRERTRFVDEALAIAKIFSRVLDDNDVEKEPSKRIAGEDKTGILRWAQ
jgi:putative DNA methylase